MMSNPSSSTLPDKDEKCTCHDPPSTITFHLRRFLALSLLIAVMGLSFFHLHKSNLSTDVSSATSIELEQLHSKNHQYYAQHAHMNKNYSMQQSLPSRREAQQRRQLLSLKKFLHPKSTKLRESNNITTTAEPLVIPPYNHQNIIMTPATFKSEIFILYYDPTADEFLIYFHETKDTYFSPVYSPIWNRFRTILPILTQALRDRFAERFQVREFIVLLSTGEIPKLFCYCVQEEERLKRPNFCRNDQLAPILHFGSVYKDTTILPSVVIMPQWSHLPCFTEWQRDGSVCEELRMRHDVAGVLGGGEALDGKQMPFSTWDSLIPTMMWRGSDALFLECVHPHLIRDIAGANLRFGDHARGVVQSLLDVWDNLTPRWKAVTMSAIAQLDAKEANGATIPWIDARFVLKQPVDPWLQQRYQPFKDYGIHTTSEKMSLSQLSKFKYHLDLGGGGGTTWFGTIEKLAMPGVLFHHVTSSKDYFHDDLVPWKHFIPINEDLSNLREMFDWAEANSEEARKISEAGTEYVKSRAKPEVMKETYERYFVHSLRAVTYAYQPLDGEKATRQMKDWLSNWSQVGKCSGKVKEECEFKEWRVGEGDK